MLTSLSGVNPMKSVRVVVTGTVGAGKSTFVRTASNVEAVEIERKATDEILLLKKKTTVAFDFGSLTFGKNLNVHIYGTPGQSRFDFMWDILIREAHAYIVLVPVHRPSSLNHSRELLLFMKERVNVPMIIGLTHMDCPGAMTSEEIIRTLGYSNPHNQPASVIVNPNQRTSVLEALVLLIDLLDC
ncbi:MULTISPECIES: ATP/GTP-binding protein [Moorena]|uniref:GTP-binding protein n=1 Tax=Moorena TaxID=1155738 RepID=UPI00227710F7|nr:MULTISPECIES: ATP/GTP-binding protein [Moorena]